MHNDRRNPRANGLRQPHPQNNRPINSGTNAVQRSSVNREKTKANGNRQPRRAPVVNMGQTAKNVSVNRSSQNAVAAPALSKTQSAIRWFKKTFTVDKTVIEKRDLVREKGSVDYIFLIIVLILLSFGTVMVYSASYAYSKNQYNDSYYIIFRQFLFIFVGFIGMAAAVFIPPELYKKASVWYYGICFLALCAVPIIGESHGGAKRWIDIGVTEIQPSEFMKLGLVMLLAWYVDRYFERISERTNMIRSSFFGVFAPLVVTGVTCLLVLIEKHLSGTIIMALIGVIIIFASGAPLKLLWALGAVGGVGLVIFSLLTDYTKRRIDIWFHPENDPQGDGYQTLQGLYAIGSGGIFGAGLGNGTQKHGFVSQPQNDFIFTIVCEELGFIGALAVIILFLLFVWRGIVIAMKAPDIYSSLLVLGIVGKVALQSLLNIAVVTNSIPNTGISLPFFSYGGSSLCVLMVEMGIVLSISRFSKQQK